ncbi:MAG TPA: enoyl-CoA hydratase/isomerase family protein [Rudaea sp.]|jgi:enoyl-CoA hydratase/carnithine racemase|nr:enoyl-CoA hydratase/isomerase family protein [Rudaea sp.]
MLETHRHEAIVELRLARPPVNALDPQLVRHLRTAIESAPALGARGIILSGKAGMFSAGLDVPVLLSLNRKELIAFFADFFGLCGAIASSAIPIVAAISGHSPAGGAVLGIFCDYRVMARSADSSKPFRIGLNEVQVGLSVPVPIQAGLQRLIGVYRAERLMVAGTMLDSEQALAIGMVDELTEMDRVVPRATEWLRELLKLPPLAMLGTRQIARRDLAAVFENPTSFALDEFADSWFGSETQAALKALVAKLKK